MIILPHNMERFSLSEAFIVLVQTLSGDDGVDKLQAALQQHQQNVRSFRRLICGQTAKGQLHYTSLNEDELHNFDESRVKKNK